MYWVFALTCLLMIVVIAFIKFPHVELKEDERMDTGSIVQGIASEQKRNTLFFGNLCYVGTEQGIANWMSKFLQLYHGR